MSIIFVTDYYLRGIRNGTQILPNCWDLKSTGTSGYEQLRTAAEDPAQSACHRNADRSVYFKCLETRNNAYGDDYYLAQGDTAMIRFDYFVIDGDGWSAFYTSTGERPLKLDFYGEETYDTVGVVLSGLERAKGLLLFPFFRMILCSYLICWLLCVIITRN